MSVRQKSDRSTFRRARHAAVHHRVGISWFRVLGRAAVVLAARSHLILPAAAPVYLLMLLPDLLPPPFPEESWIPFAFVAFHVLVGFLAGPVGDHLEGHAPGPVAFLGSGSRSLVKTIGLAPALALATLAGLFLLIPGLLILLLGYVAIPVAAREGLSPWAAFKRSVSLTKRAFPDIFAMLLFLWFAGLAGALLVQYPAPSTGTVAWFLPRAAPFVPFTLAAILPTVVRHELVRN